MSLARLLTLSLILALPTPSWAKAWVLLDPGHGGEDAGVILNGIKEADLALDISQRIEAILKAKGMEVRSTRGQASGLSVSARVLYANQLRPGCVVSLHFNASFQSAAQGPRIFVPAEGRVDELSAPLWEQASRARASSSRDLGQSIATALGMTGPKTVQSLKLALFRGLAVPACLVELEFASQEKGADAIKDEAWRKSMAAKIADGIVDYMGDMKGGAADAKR